MPGQAASSIPNAATELFLLLQEIEICKGMISMATTNIKEPRSGNSLWLSELMLRSSLISEWQAQLAYLQDVVQQLSKKKKLSEDKMRLQEEKLLLLRQSNA